MSETGIEDTREYRIQKRAESGVHLLWWLAVYGIAVIVVCMDMFWWRTG